MCIHFVWLEDANFDLCTMNQIALEMFKFLELLCFTKNFAIIQFCLIAVFQRIPLNFHEIYDKVRMISYSHLYILKLRQKTY